MRTQPSSPPRAADVAVAARRRRLGAAATVATLALGSALAGAGTAAAVADAPVAADGTPATPGLAVSLSVHSEDRRAALADGGARVERVRTVRFAWKSR